MKKYLSIALLAFTSAIIANIHAMEGTANSSSSSSSSTSTQTTSVNLDELKKELTKCYAEYLVLLAKTNKLYAQLHTQAQKLFTTEEELNTGNNEMINEAIKSVLKSGKTCNDDLRDYVIDISNPLECLIALARQGFPELILRD